jgi:hypothetical protein
MARGGAGQAGGISRRSYLGPNPNAADNSISEGGNGLKWAAIFCFAAAPFALAWGTVLLLPEPPPQIEQKIECFKARPAVDTIVVGDSRAMSVAEEPFAAKGWSYFNMVVPCNDPEDVALQLKYALLHGTIRRVVMGVSFENMTERYPFELCAYHRDGPFATEEIVGFATVDEGPRPPAALGFFSFLKRDLLPIERANARLRWRIARALGREHLDDFLPNGVAPWRAIQEQIDSGDYDFKKNRNPDEFFRSGTYEPRYLSHAELAPHARRLYSKMFAALRERHIPCVVFETGRTDEFRKRIDAYPVLVQLERQWREFFRSESHGGIRFLDASATQDCYQNDDFIDAVHFIGLTAARLAARLADELETLEKALSQETGRAK